VRGVLHTNKTIEALGFWLPLDTHQVDGDSRSNDQASETYISSSTSFNTPTWSAGWDVLSRKQVTTTVLQSWQCAMVGTIVRNHRILLEQSFTACTPLLTATSKYGLRRRRWGSDQRYYIHNLRTFYIRKNSVILSLWKIRLILHTSRMNQPNISTAD